MGSCGSGPRGLGPLGPLRAGGAGPTGLREGGGQASAPLDAESPRMDLQSLPGPPVEPGRLDWRGPGAGGGGRGRGRG